MNPLVKWAGGKRSELPVLKPHYPERIARIVEPFAGGAAAAWDMEGVPAVINDVNKGLVDFYRDLQSPATRAAVRAALEAIGARRRHVSHIVAAFADTEVQAFFTHPSAWAARNAASLSGPSFSPVLDGRFLVLMAKHVASKGGRVAKFKATGASSFPSSELRRHVETAVQSAWYEVLRDIYNGIIPVGRGWQVASWWAVRVLCYSGMFRFSRKGHFNVPYGGTSYNSRDFADAMDDLFGPRRVAELARLHVESMDFEALFTAYDGFAPADFLFVDPPYDSAFSQYNVEGDFVSSDQMRLRDVLERSPARWMLVIKRTPFIENLYAGRGHHLHVFGKTYGANFRNRHARAVEHLVVTNYPITPSGASPLRPAIEG